MNGCAAAVTNWPIYTGIIEYGADSDIDANGQGSTRISPPSPFSAPPTINPLCSP